MGIPHIVVLIVIVFACPLTGSLLAADPLSGKVHDPRGAAVADAQTSLLTAQQTVIASTRTDSRGQFSFSGIPAGSYVLLVSARGFAPRRLAVLQGTDQEPLDVTLDVRPLEERVTVTAEIGAAEKAELVIQPVNVLGEESIRERVTDVVAQVASEESGVHLQRTSPTMAGIFVRGLTGNKVNVFFDGVRYSTSAMRGGVSTFLDLIEPSNLQTVEILRGPNSAQYGSDAIGGSLQLLSRLPPASVSDRPEFHGSVDTLFDSADAGAATNVTSSYAAEKLALMANMAGRRTSTLKTGGAIDSHGAVTRFLGLRSDVAVPGRLPDTAFTQYGGMIKLIWKRSALSQVVAHYSRSQVDGGKRYDQLLGGDGNLIADLRNLMLDLAYVRFNRFKLGWFDQFSAAYSFNSQREERVNQGGSGNPRAAINHEYERTNANGIQAHLSKFRIRGQQLAAGAEYYHERIHAPSFGVNPVTQLATLRRGRVPDNARYDSGGVYLQNTFEALRNRLRLVGSLRYSAASYRARAADSPLTAGQPLWPNDSLRVSDFCYRAGFVARIVSDLNLYANVSHGFRAPHVTDLGTFGLTGSGFEVAAPEVAGMGGLVGSSAGADAVSTSRKVEQVKPESSRNFEAGVRYRNGRIATEFTVFINDITDNITKQALILPAGAVGLLLAGQPVTAQNANGVVYVAVATNPVLVRTNYDDARIKGIEHSLDVRLRGDLTVRTRFTRLSAHDKRTNLPPNIEGGTPAPDGYLKIRYYPGKGRTWFEPYIHAAQRQDRLSSLDLEDRRTGGGRSRSSIRSFFLNGATYRGLVGIGPDGIPGTADDRLLATGETLAQVQDRVLIRGVQSAPLFPALPGYIAFNLRAGFRLGERQDLLFDIVNISDRNYRGISWGLDAPGRSVVVRYRVAW